MRKRFFAVAVAALLGASLASCATGAILVGKAIEAKRQANATGNQAEFVGELQPLPVGRKVAVWPRDQVQVALADKLREAQFEVVGPAALATMVTQAGVNQNIDNANETQLQASFKVACDKSGADLVIAGRPAGAGAVDLLAFPCAKAMLWTDRMNLGGASGAAIDRVTTMWRTRIQDAQALGAQQQASAQ